MDNLARLSPDFFILQSGLQGSVLSKRCLCVSSILSITYGCHRLHKDTKILRNWQTQCGYRKQHITTTTLPQLVQQRRCHSFAPLFKPFPWFCFIGFISTQVNDLFIDNTDSKILTSLSHFFCFGWRKYVVKIKNLHLETYSKELAKQVCYCNNHDALYFKSLEVL